LIYAIYFHLPVLKYRWRKHFAVSVIGAGG
jgi:hypothetical protein